MYLRAREKKKRKARENELMNLGLREALKKYEAETNRLTDIGKVGSDGVVELDDKSFLHLQPELEKHIETKTACQARPGPMDNAERCRR